ncbi:MAG TPA: hypothetical protein VJU59_25505 [Paraburkholderia sp.]|uniref:hypothetical protein n=1 Tax=Paraburkholderia sp. TaxID=1926495 RepID=UPI002B465CCE|nr:hypothetical protein [Paraburkholderia sp.]HKR42997.1 hypothetical protein [Paraburkholderia sp.]
MFAFVTSFVCLLISNARSDEVPGRHFVDEMLETPMITARGTIDARAIEAIVRLLAPADFQ